MANTVSTLSPSGAFTSRSTLSLCRHSFGDAVSNYVHDAVIRGAYLCVCVCMCLSVDKV